LKGVKEEKGNEWMFNNVQALEFENGGVVTFIPKNRFDALLQVDESDAPTY